VKISRQIKNLYANVGGNLPGPLGDFNPPYIGSYPIKTQEVKAASIFFVSYQTFFIKKCQDKKSK